MRRIISQISDATDAWCFVPNNVWDSEKNKQRDLLFDGLKSIKYNSDSEELELMVNAPSMAYIIWVLWSVFWTVLSDKEGEKGNNKNSATGNNCTLWYRRKLNKTFVSIRF